MDEKSYRIMSNCGAWSLALGIVVAATGIASGVMLIVNGARLLKQKYKVTI